MVILETSESKTFETANSRFFNNHETSEIPPNGGIFLSPEFVVPPLIYDLIQSLPELQSLSHQAKALLEDEYEKVCLEYGDRFRLNNELHLSAEAIYSRLFTNVSSSGWKTNEENAYVVETVGKIENLKSLASAYEDARSTICGFGEHLVDIVKPEFTPGTHLLGSHQYEVLEGKFGGSKHLWLCGFDQTTSERVYFNRWNEITEPLARPAFLHDYVQFMNDVIVLEQ